MDNSAEKYIGKLLDGRYEILELIGSGGMANVYKALCHRLNRYDAIKIMRDDTAANDSFRKKFKAESQAVAMLSHPNIVSVYDVSHSDDVEYIVMELIDGVTLKQYMQKMGALSSEEVLSFSTQIAKALVHAHERGIIHRDIKPQNIMLLKDGMIKVADFGIASLQNEIEDSKHETVGSVHYISPEQARGAAADARSDIYSLGIVMYEMLTGKLPYTGNSDVEIAVMHINSEAVAPSKLNNNIPEELERICLKAMSSDISERYQSAEELLADLEEYKNRTLAAQVLDSTDSTETASISSEEAIGARKRNKVNRKSKKLAFSSGILAVLILIILIFVFLIGYFIKDIFAEPTKVEVPKFIDRYYEDVINDEDYEKQFKFTVIFKVDLEHDEGIILDQTPKPGRPQAINERSGKVEVELIISAGEALPENERVGIVPSVVNNDRSEAISKIQDAGFTYSIVEAPSSSITKGYVILTEPAAGESADKGTEVKITISSGPETELTSVPKLIGLSKDAAIEKIEASNLSLGSISSEESDLDAGTVLWQSREAGESVEVHTKIFIKISSGPKGDE